MDPQAAVDLVARPSHRSLAGHFFALGVYVFVFGVLAYLAFLNHGGIAGQLLLIYLSSLPLAIAIDAVVMIARARQKLAAHHVIGGCLSAVLLCGIGGIWMAFREQIVFGILASLAIVWLTRYSPAADFLRPPTFADLAAPDPQSGHRALRTAATLGGAAVFLFAGIGLTLAALVGQMERPGGFSFTIGG